MSSWRPDIDVILTDSEDEDDFSRDFRGREAMIFVVDANLYAEKERFTQTLEIIRGAFISGISINHGKDLVGVVFANTEKSPTPYEPNCLENISVPDNCAVFLPPRQLTKPIVEHYLRFLMTALEDFGTDFGIAPNGGCGNFAAMIRLCLNLFDHCGYSLNNSTIVFMTDRETPHPTDSPLYQMALQKAKDLDGKEVEFKFIPMVDEFDYDVFYKEFLTLARDVELDSFVVPDPQQLREILADRKLTQDFLKRCLGHFKFSLGPNLDLAVAYYNYYQLKSYPRKVKLLRKDNSIVQQKRVIVVRKQDAETLEFTDEHRILASGGWSEINIGAMPIRITPEQLNRVRNLHAPGMMLLGFKPRTELPENLYYKPCNFMYPDDQSIVGSKRLFCALWQRCMARDKIAIGLFMRKRRSIPRFVALVPVAAADSEDSKDFHSLLRGDGFKLVYLPMAKHIRNINFDEWNSVENTASDAGVELFQKIIRKLRIKYQPSLINEPALEQLQSNLLALALNIQTDHGGVTDMPDADMQDKRIEQLLPDLDSIFGEDIESAKKRAASRTNGEGPVAKVAKITDDDIKNFDYVQQLIANKTLNSCTVAQLRAILDEHFDVTLAKSITKAAVIERIYALNK